MAKEPGDVLDIGIIGAGCAGAYSAWRLQAKYGGEKKIGLFEYSDRVGGRLYTRTLPGMPHVHSELGGMRYEPKSHILVKEVIDVLRLCSKPFPMGNPDPAIGAKRNLFYLRRKHLLQADLGNSAEVPYKVRWDERNKTPDDLQTQVADLLVPGWRDFTLDQWVQADVFGKKLYKYGFWNLLYRVLSSEAYALMLDAGGYQANVANSNSVSQLPATDYGPATEFRTLVDGYDELPKTLVQKFQDDKGQFLPNLRLKHIDRPEPGGNYRLTFVKTVTEDHLTHDTGEEVSYQARQLVLAMPRFALGRIEWSGWQDKWLKKNLKSVLIQKAFKLFLGYEYPWWRALDLYAGRSITDMPIRQVYYFGTEGEQPNSNAENRNSLLMASYNDMRTVPFWKGLEEGEAYQGYRPKFLPPGEDPMPAAAHPTTVDLIGAAEDQIAELHAQKELPRPYSGIYHEWSAYPYGGGWHEWKAGFRFDKVMKRMRHPISDEEVYICGSAYSNDQAWVEGALQTAEQMRQEHFGLDRPEWLPKSYDLGP